MRNHSRVLIVGGTGFAGSPIGDLMLEENAAEIVVLVNFVRGRRENLSVEHA